MLTNQERYFIWNIVHPSNEIKHLIGVMGQPIYNDDQYSLLKERIGLLCAKVLHIFEQPEFSVAYGKKKREEMNRNDACFHRVLSYGIKEKHGQITNKHYSELNLNIPLSVYVYQERLKYDYFYHPNLINSNSEEFSLLEDLSHAIGTLVSLYGLSIKGMEPMFQPSPKYPVENNTIHLHPIDIYNYFGNGMTSSINIRTYEQCEGKWVPVDLPFQIDFKLLASDINT
ncbi:MAG: hypothetical protein RI556_09895 [Hydrogenovibrio sp.]|uniref:hypothetical protein n=1 Tax=Hydrogenovibrio sp. TaxID=2065821 RepID=UPI00286FB0F8|nr:hypothetical protein [Hydrogenovibrio sp.]MDR9499475.1 hypothetical protein [Hydrogenovibrio sp.]